MQCTIASILDLQYEEVPPFIELGDRWYKEICNTFEKYGYKYKGMGFNKKWQEIRQF